MTEGRDRSQIHLFRVVTDAKRHRQTLDEGFPTLDAETLNVAVEAIQSLQEGERMIAVISHVTDLVERLPCRIQVIKGVSGSEIRMQQESTA